MPWNTPRTWVNGEVNTASLMNAHVRDNMRWIEDVPAFRYVDNAVQTIPSANILKQVRFNTMIHDTGGSGFHKNGADVFRVKRAGVWYFTASIAVMTTTATSMYVEIKHSTTGELIAWSGQTSKTGGTMAACCVEGFFRCALNDDIVVNVLLWADTGTVPTLSPAYPTMSGIWMRDP